MRALRGAERRLLAAGLRVWLPADRYHPALVVTRPHLAFEGDPGPFTSIAITRL